MDYDIQNLPETVILTGGFGSGKSEVAINLCLKLTRQLRCTASGHEPKLKRDITPGDGVVPALVHDIGTSTVVLADLDLVKPMFRSRELAEYLKERGIRVLSSAPGLDDIDLPALSPELVSILGPSRGTGKLIVDVGGDETGAKALGRFAASLQKSGYAMYMVVNPYRPSHRDASTVQSLRGMIENRSKLEITAIVSNPNLGCDTGIDEFIKGHEAVCRISEEIGLPIVFVGVHENVWAGIHTERLNENPIRMRVPIIQIVQHLLPPWAGSREV